MLARSMASSFVMPKKRYVSIGLGLGAGEWGGGPAASARVGVVTGTLRYDSVPPG